MQFLYSEDSGKETLTLTGEEHKYLFKVRRFQVGKELSFRNMKDATLYRYRIQEIGKKEAMLIMIEHYHDEKKSAHNLHILWCIIDTKIIEKTLPLLNQMGLSKISFLYCDRSQKNFKPDLLRLEKILINSSQQCGRSDLMSLEILDSLDVAIQQYSTFAVMDFGGTTKTQEVESIMIGCEGGFSEQEREKLEKHQKIGINSPLILKSETATVAFCAKVLL